VVDVPLYPLTVEFAELAEEDTWQFLDNIAPIEDVAHLALHVAQLTMGLGELKRRFDEQFVTEDEMFERFKERLKNERGQ
jgi:hypothetical protein